MVKGTCRNRAESAAMDDLSRSLVLVNYFRDLPAFPEACKDNSAQLMDALAACHAKSGNRWANYIAVDFYRVSLLTTVLLHRCASESLVRANSSSVMQRSDRGGAAAATDKANGGLICGCGSISACSVRPPRCTKLIRFRKRILNF